MKDISFTAYIKFILIITFFISLPLNGMEKWKITSLDWPPFSGQHIPLQGMAIAVLREALKTESIDLIVEFYPWTRSIETAKDPSYLGYYPAWPEEVVDGFTKSAALFQSPVGLVEPVEKPLVWNTLSDLKGKMIGTVQSYGNTIEFNQLIKNGTILTEVTMDDRTNIRKVAAGRIDGAFMDLNNLNYLLKFDLKVLSGMVRANEKIIDTKDIIIAINKKFSNKKSAKIIKRAMARVNAQIIIQNYKINYLK